MRHIKKFNENWIGNIFNKPNRKPDFKGILKGIDNEKDFRIEIENRFISLFEYFNAEHLNIRQVSNDQVGQLPDIFFTCSRFFTGSKKDHRYISRNEFTEDEALTRSDTTYLIVLDLYVKNDIIRRGEIDIKEIDQKIENLRNNLLKEGVASTTRLEWGEREAEPIDRWKKWTIYVENYQSVCNSNKDMKMFYSKVKNYKNAKEKFKIPS